MSIINKLYNIHKEAVKFGFVWPNAHCAVDQIISECNEVKEVIIENQAIERLEEEVGDLLQAGLELCFHLKLDPEIILQQAFNKYSKRITALKQISTDLGYTDINGIDMKQSLWKMAKDKAALEKGYNIALSNLTANDIPIISTAFTNIGWNKPEEIYLEYLQQQQQGKRKIWLAWVENNFAGYITLLKQSHYPPFLQQSISEISDLNVLPHYRNQGIASSLLAAAEKEASTINNVVGLGVGLTSDYGNAHRLYLSRGYIPDGKGLTYNYKPLAYGDQAILDDDLVLWLTKQLY